MFDEIVRIFHAGFILKRSWSYFAYLEKVDAHLIINFCVIDF
jgi:hypothetical protein